MRWDLRPDDWDKIWPELVDHPCALLFAPRHPERDGPPRFRDWVDSWPTGFDWEHDLPEHIHEAVRHALEESASIVDASTRTALESSPAVTDPEVKEARRSIQVEELIELLAVLLLEIDETKRLEISRQLQTLALAPDSGRVIQSLKLLLDAG